MPVPKLTLLGDLQMYDKCAQKVSTFKALTMYPLWKTSQSDQKIVTRVTSEYGIAVNMRADTTCTQNLLILHVDSRKGRAYLGS